MKKQKIKNKYVLLGDIDSINIEIIIKSFKYLKNKVNYLIICNKNDLANNTYLKLNEIFDPISFKNYNQNKLNYFNVENISNKKYLNILNQIKVANNLANLTKFDLITLPIDKSLFKKNINFIGMTEYLGKINNKFTIMLMYGENFSVIPLTTHINIKDVYKSKHPIVDFSKKMKMIDNQIKDFFINNLIKCNLRNSSFFKSFLHCEFNIFHIF